MGFEPSVRVTVHGISSAVVSSTADRFELSGHPRCRPHPGSQSDGRVAPTKATASAISGPGARSVGHRSRDACTMAVKIARAASLQSSRASWVLRRPRRTVRFSTEFSLSPAHHPFDHNESVLRAESPDLRPPNCTAASLISSPRGSSIQPRGTCPQPFFRATDESERKRHALQREEESQWADGVHNLNPFVVRPL
jgi:hypothetical protein